MDTFFRLITSVLPSPDSPSFLSAGAAVSPSGRAAKSFPLWTIGFWLIRSACKEAISANGSNISPISWVTNNRVPTVSCPDTTRFPPAIRTIKRASVLIILGSSFVISR